LDESLTSFSEEKAFKDLHNNSTHRDGEVAQWMQIWGASSRPIQGTSLKKASQELCHTTPGMTWVKCSVDGSLKSFPISI
jgi:hypothetical protein